MLVDRCPGCGKPVAEADTVCPHCGRDFSAPVARKPAPKPAPKPEPEEKPAAKETEAPAKPAAKEPAEAPPPPKEKPKLEEPPPQTPPPASAAPFEPTPFEDPSPGAYVPGAYRPDEDSYKVAKDPGRPAWHWLVMAVLCVAAFKFIPKGPTLPVPDDAPPKAAAPQPAAPVAVPGDLGAAAKALTDAKDAAAARPPGDPTVGSIVDDARGAAGQARPPKATRPPPREEPEPVHPDDVDRTPDDAPIVITQAGVEDAPRRKGAPAAAKEWRMRGAIYDLLSTDPIKGADVVFMDAKTGRRFATGTDAQGRYRATLPVVEEGYDLAIRHPRYEPKYFEDGVPSYRELAIEQRQSAATDLMRILQTKEMIVGVGGTVLERDFVLIPLNR